MGIVLWLPQERPALIAAEIDKRIYFLNMNIRAILFDLGNVLVDFSFQDALSHLSAVTGKTPKAIHEFFFQSDLERRFEVAALDPLEFFEEVRAGLGFPGSFAEFADIWNNIFVENPQAQGLLARLKTAYPIVLVSNTNEMHFNHVEKHCRVLDHVHHLILSHRVKARKPHPDIYHAALKAAGVKASEAVFVDDLIVNVTAAKELGLHAVHFQGMDHLESEFQSLGIL